MATNCREKTRRRLFEERGLRRSSSVDSGLRVNHEDASLPTAESTGASTLATASDAPVLREPSVPTPPRPSRRSLPAQQSRRCTFQRPVEPTKSQSTLKDKVIDMFRRNGGRDAEDLELSSTYVTGDMWTRLIDVDSAFIYAVHYALAGNCGDEVWALCTVPDEGVQMEELLDFSFERVGKLAAEKGVQLDDAHKEELWLYVQRMKAEQQDWVSMSHYQDHSSRQQFDSCLDDFTGASRFHTAQLSWDPHQSWDQSYHASFSRDSLETTALPREEKDDVAESHNVKTKSSKRTCKTPKTFRLSKCDLSPISAKPKAPIRRSRSKVAALLSRLVHERSTKEPLEDRFFTRGIWPSWLNFNATPKR
ncbi:hypothetical protein HPB52_014838 [Rhipicephalus sanguineus]|uniref:Uncharacterized protein n=1 Tax=Rhipicephalus sanguineus TaxID=34632 RepID=A0A9D4PMW9_RHISA|nr:hypothetical protein HPB52_014838 [Rhipicephalus sanguineus]